MGLKRREKGCEGGKDRDVIEGKGENGGNDKSI